MKKLLSFLLLLSYTASSFAEDGCAEHALMVHHLSYWAPKYLTITNNWNNLCFTNAPTSLKSLSVVTEINGQSTENMEPEVFYNIIDNSEKFTIHYISKIRGINVENTVELITKKGHLFYFNSSSEDIVVDNNYDDYWYFVNNYYERGTTLSSDNTVDFFQFNTFDFMVAGDDYLTDKNILQNFSKELVKKGLVYSAENPDLYLYLTKDASTKIETIYVPEIVYSTHSNSYTRGNGYIYINNNRALEKTSFNTTENSTTRVRDEGKTKDVVNNNLFLQFSILEARKMKNATPPIVWQLIYNTHASYETNMINRTKLLNFFVFAYPTSSINIGRKIVSPGFFLQNNLKNSGLICDVINGSWADTNGIKVGQVIKSIKNKDKESTIYRYEYKVGIGKPINEKLASRCDEYTIGNKTYKINPFYEIKYFFIPESEIE